MMARPPLQSFDAYYEGILAQTRALNCAEQIENGTCKSNEVAETILKIP